MKPFRCDCGALIFFDNVKCLTCGRELGFAPEVHSLVALEAAPDGNYLNRLEPKVPYAKCHNYTEYQACNWLVPVGSDSALCRSCRLNRVIPDLSNDDNRVKWARVEAAKRRLIYGLDALKLPLESKEANVELGLAFDIKAGTAENVVITGHQDGVITFNLDEADSVTREKTRLAMNERYRCPLGHLRHESGHYYFDLLLRNSPAIMEFRQLFGDEREDYDAALKQHYARVGNAEPSPDFVSHYASSHPWEDWAETWAHYLHMVDTLETAQSFGAMKNKARTFDELISSWLRLTIVLNALNHSMGLDDAYPFQIGSVVKCKLEFIHRIVLARTRARRRRATQRVRQPGQSLES